jgi:hypothetical protein
MTPGRGRKGLIAVVGVSRKISRTKGLALVRLERKLALSIEVDAPSGGG